MPIRVQIHNRSRTLARPVVATLCESFGCRLRGLMFRGRLAPDDGLLLVERGESRFGASIHMWFVGFELSVFWLNEQLRVVDRVMAKPWRLAYFPRVRAKYILEIHPRRWNDYEIGDQVEIQPA